jgi:uncharacterized protein (UPF0248 family)
VRSAGEARVPSSNIGRYRFDDELPTPSKVLSLEPKAIPVHRVVHRNCGKFDEPPKALKRQADCGFGFSVR